MHASSRKLAALALATLISSTSCLALVEPAGGLEGDSQGSGADPASGIGSGSGSGIGTGGGEGTGSGAGGGGGTDIGAGSTCRAASLLSGLERARLMIGAQMDDGPAGATSWDVRYRYLAGELFSGSAPCGSCASCNTNWWGCWQGTDQPPGEYARAHVRKAASAGQLPMFTYYIESQAWGAGDGDSELDALNSASFLTRYLADFRFLLQQIGPAKALLHLEPDLWGYAQQRAASPAGIPAKVRAANAADCAGFDDTMAGLGRCMVAMVRKYAPATRVGFHASAWATGVDVGSNRSASLDVVAEARKVADYLGALGGGEADFIVVEMSDRDAGYYETVRKMDRWWDATNQRLPNFRQHFTWAKALAERANKPLLWWQVPVGNMALDNTATHYRDNRLDYLFEHLDEVVAAHGAGVLFGAGERQQTNPSSDGGNLLNRAKAYVTAGGQRPCP